MLHDLNIDTTLRMFRYSLTPTRRRLINASQSSTRIMPIPKPVEDQLRQIIPPLNGKLHKGQSGMLASNSTPTLPSYATQAVSECSEGHSSTFPNLIALVNIIIELQLYGSPIFCCDLRPTSSMYYTTGFALHHTYQTARLGSGSLSCNLLPNCCRFH